MRHLKGGSVPPIPFVRRFSGAAGLAALCSSASLIGLVLTSPASADVVWVTKDCSLSPCTITTGGSPGPTLAPGRFRAIGQPISWEALYTGSPTQAKRFWVSQGGMNMATNELTTASGQAAGSSSLPSGLWYISAQTFLMGPGNYAVFGPNVKGDPHITTMDGVHYDFQAAGEFTLLKNADAGFEVQSRMAPVSTVGPLPPDPHTGISTCPSINTAAAIKSPRHRLSYQPGLAKNAQTPRMLLRIDGVRRAVPRQGVTLNDGTRVNLDRTSGELRVRLRNGWGVRIVPTWWSATGLWYLDYDFTPATSATGVAGPIAPRSWLPALSDGTSVGTMPGPIPQRYKVLYRQFADSWRVTSASSLFDYPAGTSTATHSDPAWPREDGRCRLPNTNPLAQLSEAEATRICARIHVPNFRRACIADVMATGDKVFASGYAKLEGPGRFKGRAEDGKAPRAQ